MILENPDSRVIKKIGSSRVIWFPDSNRWVEFKEPAWFIYEKYCAGEDEQSTVDRLTERYNLPIEEAHRFYSEITAGIDHSAKKKVPDTTGEIPGGAFLKPGSGPFGNTRHKDRHYMVNMKQFTIRYGSPLLEYYIHRPLAHLETEECLEGSLMIRLYEEAAQKPGEGAGHKSAGTGSDTTGTGRYHLQIKPVGSEETSYYVFEDPGYIKHRVYNAITNHIYNIPEEGWMSYIHASAVTNGKEAVLLSSASGSGKSTIAALLQISHMISPTASGNPANVSSEPISPVNEELYFMSDDFVPVDAATLRAHPFPAALTVKEGSFQVISPFYDPADDADSGYIGPANKKVRYLRPRFPERDPFKPQPVKNIIYIKHNPDEECRLEKLDTITALAAFHEEAWVSHNPGHARNFIDWFVTLSCYRLDYSDNRKAIEAIKQIISRS